ncbi:MAG: CHAT domain-containing protein [Caldilineaceae bacterium]
MADSAPPVILLAFARSEDPHFQGLPRLPEEARLLREALEPAEAAGQIKLEIRQDATLDDILRVFERYHGRVAIFHFAGHTDDQTLLAERLLGAEALLAAVHAQTELKLVFLNACENHAQAAGLHAAGVPAAIVTTGEVEDDLCPTFAMRFYRALAGGFTLAESFAKARLAAEGEAYAQAGRSDISPWLLSMPDPAAGTWRLPQRTQHFTGREQELADLLAGDIQEIKSTLVRVASVSDMVGRYMVGTRKEFGVVIAAFLETYLGTDELPKPFGGRTSILDDLDTWLRSPGRKRYRFLHAPAGRGKSALLAHWLARVMQRDEVHAAFVSISPRFESTSSEVVFGALASQLAQIHAEDLPLAHESGADYRRLVGAYLRRAPADGRPLLLVVDGLDESPEWLLKADVVPPVPPPHLRVVCSARTGIAGSVQSYLQLLNWSQEVCLLDELGGLSQAGLLDVLSNLGEPLPALMENAEFVDRLYALTGGDPLLVTLYAEALRPYGDEPPVISSAEDLVGLQSGYDGFFKSLFMRQYEDQEAIWRAGGDRAPALPVGPLLCVLAVALGPLASDDLRVLLADVFPDQATLIATIKSLRRFLLSQTSRPYGDAGDGYVFSHVRMADYFGSEAWMSQSDRQATVRRLTGYCRNHCAAIRGGELAPSASSAYVVQYWGAHLVKHVAAPRAELAELICEPWLRAWEHVTGTASGFLTDADRAAEFARKEGAAGIGMQLRVALCHSSLASLGANLQKDVLLALAKANRISPPRAIDLALNRQSLRARVEYLVALRSVLPADWHEHTYKLALSIARGMRDVKQQADTLFYIADHVAELPSNALVEQVRTLAYASDSVDLFCRLLDRVPAPDRDELVAAALARIGEGPDYFGMPFDLGRLATFLSGEQKIAVLRQAIEAATRLASIDMTSVTDALMGLIDTIPDGETELLLAAKQIAVWFGGVAGVGRLIAKMPATAHAEIQILLASAPNRYSLQALANREFGPDDAPDLYAYALELARGIADVRDRAWALLALAAKYSGAEQQAVLAAAIQAINAFPNGVYRIDILLSLADFYNGPERRHFLDQVLTIARSFADSQIRADALFKIAQHLPAADCQTVMLESLACSEHGYIGNAEYRTMVLTRHAAYIPEATAVSVVRLLSGAEELYSRYIGDMLQHLPFAHFSPQQSHMIAEAALELILFKYGDSIFDLPTASLRQLTAWYVVSGQPVLRYVDGLPTNIIAKFSYYLTFERRQALLARLVAPLAGQPHTDRIADLIRQAKYLAGLGDQDAVLGGAVHGDRQIRDVQVRIQAFLTVIGAAAPNQRLALGPVALRIAAAARTIDRSPIALLYLNTAEFERVVTLLFDLAVLAPSARRPIYRILFELACDQGFLSIIHHLTMRIRISAKTGPRAAVPLFRPRPAPLLGISEHIYVARIYAILRAFEQACRTDRLEFRRDQLLSLLPLLPPDLAEEANSAFLSAVIEDSSMASRTRVWQKYLQLWAPEDRAALLDAVFEQAVSPALSFRDCCDLLFGLFDSFSLPQKRRAVAIVLQSMPDRDEPFGAGYGLTELVKHLPAELDDLLDEALTVTFKLVGGGQQLASYLPQLLARVPVTDGERLLSIKSSLEQLPLDEHIVQSVVILAQKAEDLAFRRSLLAAALACALGVAGEVQRSRSLVPVAAALLHAGDTTTVVQAILPIVLTLPDESHRMHRLGEILGAASGSPMDEAFCACIIDSVRGISSEYHRTQGFVVLLDHMPPELDALRWEAGTAALAQTQGLANRKHLLCVLARHAHGHQRGELLQSALACARLEELQVLSHHTPLVEVVDCIQARERDLLASALDAVAQCQSHDQAYRCLGILGPKLPADADGLWKKAMAIVQSRSEHSSLGYGDAKVIPGLVAIILGSPVTRHTLALEVLRYVQQFPKDVLGQVVPFWPEICRSAGLDEVEELLRVLDVQKRRPRGELLETLIALVPLLARLGGAASLEQAALAIADTADWWP